MTGEAPLVNPENPNTVDHAERARRWRTCPIPAAT